jgi:glc operon protein GlcG
MLRALPTWGEKSMRLGALTAITIAVYAVAAGVAYAQQPSSPPDLNVIPEKMPFNIPFGLPIGLDRAQSVIQAGIDEAKKRDWAMDIAVVDTGGNLVAFARMDGALLGSIAIAEHKARAAARFRRPTRVFEDAVQHGIPYVATLDDVIASRGGIPLIEEGKIIGAVGCSGGAGSQDEAICQAAAATINKTQ